MSFASNVGQWRRWARLKGLVLGHGAREQQEEGFRRWRCDFNHRDWRSRMVVCMCVCVYVCVWKAVFCWSVNICYDAAAADDDDWSHLCLIVCSYCHSLMWSYNVDCVTSWFMRASCVRGAVSIRGSHDSRPESPDSSSLVLCKCSTSTCNPPHPPEKCRQFWPRLLVCWEINTRA